MNRMAHLSTTAPRISRWGGHQEHLILDWSSDPPVRRDALPADGRIRLLRVDGETRWHLSRAYNFAISRARGPFVLKLDADCWLTDDEAPLPPPEAGTYQRSASGGGLNGIFLIRQRDFLAAGGFHEGLQGYGHDDKDLYQRLDRRLQCRFLPPERFGTLEHGDSERVAAQPGLAGLQDRGSAMVAGSPRRDLLASLEAIARMEESKAANRLLGDWWPWSADQPRTDYREIGRDRWIAVPASLPRGEAATLAEARAVGNRVYLALLLGLPERFLDREIPRQDLERVRSWGQLLRLQARLRLMLLMPLLRSGPRLQRLLAWIRSGRFRRGRS
jgi:hypothetical protein